MWCCRSRINSPPALIVDVIWFHVISCVVFFSRDLFSPIIIARCFMRCDVIIRSIYQAGSILMWCYYCVWYYLLWCGVRWRDLMRCDLIWCDVIWSDAMWSNMIWCDLMRYWRTLCLLLWQVGRCKSSGIRDHHVSRRHVEVTVPDEGEDGSQQGTVNIWNTL